MKAKEWRLKEIQFIKTNYEKISIKEMAGHLGRTYENVRGKARHLGLRREPETSDVAAQKLLRLFEFLQQFHRGGKTLKELSKIMRVSERTTYRYLNLFLVMNIAIEQDFEGKYFIASDNCPLCNQQHTTK